MDRQAIDRMLRPLVPADAVHADEPLAPHTTFQVGGTADWFVEIQSEDQLRGVMAVAREAGVPITVLGGGSNVVVSDEGVRGVVIRLRMTDVSQPDAATVRAEAGLTMNGLVRWTIGRGLAGLQAWAGTPGTVGGAVYGNAHYGGRNIGDLVRRVRLTTRGGEVATIAAAEMEFAYDTSRLQRTGEILLSADFGVAPGQADELRAAARASLAHRKLTQPLAQPSAGCLFQNPDPRRDVLPAGIPASAGALIDRAGLKGHRHGGASISTVHANFVVNDGSASARDIWLLAEQARTTVRDRFGVELRNEVVFLGKF
jgi:UDP-N-acetylmuramate dehydrogenase